MDIENLLRQALDLGEEGNWEGMARELSQALALDPAMSELEIAYREEFDVPDAVGMYLFWRDKALNVLDRDGVLDIYTQAMQEFNIPILSIEDGFSEDDHEGWKKIVEKLGSRVLVIGDGEGRTSTWQVPFVLGLFCFFESGCCTESVDATVSITCLQAG